jgi:integrase
MELHNPATAHGEIVAAIVRSVLTDRLLRSLKPAEKGKRRIIWDGDTSHFAVRVTPTGKKTFCLIMRWPGGIHPAPREIGVYPEMSLSAAREKARSWLESVRNGIDPAKAEEAAEAQQTTFRDSVDLFAKHHLSRRRTGAEVERALRRELLAERMSGQGNWEIDKALLRAGCGMWRDMFLTDISRKEIIRVIYRVHDGYTTSDGQVVPPRPIQGNRLLAYKKKLFAFCVQRGLIEMSPAALVQKPAQERKRDRVLSDPEIRAIWKACDGFGAFGRAVKLMLVTGQRRNEIAALTWSEIDNGAKLWTIPAARTKNAREHLIALSPLALDIIGDTRIGNFIFSTGAKGDVAISGWSKFKSALDIAVKKDLRGVCADDDTSKIHLEPWHLHDLRRTCATNLARIGVDRQTVEKILNHSDGTVTAVYDRFDRLDERRKALDKWATRLQDIVEPSPSDNVVRSTLPRGPENGQGRRRSVQEDFIRFNR